MQHQSSASAQPSTTDRVARGRALFEERWREIQHLEGATWLVPATNGTRYLVNLDAPSCECSDFERRAPKLCKHLAAAAIANAKSVTCSCCGERVLGRFAAEVEENDGLLAWFPGDIICADCVRAGAWA